MESLGDGDDYQDQMEEEDESYEGSVDGAQTVVSSQFGFGSPSAPGTPGTDLFFAQHQIGDGVSTADGEGPDGGFNLDYNDNENFSDQNFDDRHMSDGQNEGGATRYHDESFYGSLGNSPARHNGSNLAELRAVIEQMKMNNEVIEAKIKATVSDRSDSYFHRTTSINCDQYCVVQEAIQLSKQQQIEAQNKRLAYGRKYVATRRMKIDEIREKNRKLEEK